MTLVILPDHEPDELAIDLFIQRLGASRNAAVRLDKEGYSTIEEVAYVPIERLRETGLEEPVLMELQAKARRILEQEG